MSRIPGSLLRAVFRRANGRCEWSEHFVWDAAVAVGLTSIGRVTTSALGLNRTVMLAIRSEEALLGRHPMKSEQ